MLVILKKIQNYILFDILSKYSFKPTFGLYRVNDRSYLNDLIAWMCGGNWNEDCYQFRSRQGSDHFRFLIPYQPSEEELNSIPF